MGIRKKIEKREGNKKSLKRRRWRREFWKKLLEDELVQKQGLRGGPKRKLGYLIHKETSLPQNEEGRFA